MALLKTDIAENLRAAGREPSLAALLRTLPTVRSAAVLLFRLSQRAGRLHPLLGSLVKQLNHVLTGADLAWQAEVGGGLVLFHPTGVVIGPHAVVGRRCHLQQGVTIGGDGGPDGGAGSSPAIGDDVRIGAGARILGRVDVGSGATVGANAVVVDDVPAGSVARGIPARWRARDGN
jgi:serine O-acetyltransferase